MSDETKSGLAIQPGPTRPPEPTRNALAQPAPRLLIVYRIPMAYLAGVPS